MQFNVTELSGAFQGDQATVQEMEHIVRYAPPTFAVYAAVTASLEAGEAARVGLVQEVVSRRQDHVYPSGTGRWEIGALDERPISGSDGGVIPGNVLLGPSANEADGYYWYPNGGGRTLIVAPTSPRL